MDGPQPLADDDKLRCTSHTVARPRCKPSDYRDAADQARYRRPDAPLFSCHAHGAATVLCTTAGKTGRNGTTATVGATLFWLTCPYLNNLVARLERLGAVQSVRRLFLSHPHACLAHEASHAVFEKHAETLLSPAQWDFFRSHFLEPADPALRKYGNAAVAQPSDVKCLHALVAQYLGGADNCVGRITAQYISHLHALIPPGRLDDTDGGADQAAVAGEKRAASGDEPRSTEVSDADAAIKKQMDDIASFEAFFVSHLSPDEADTTLSPSLDAASPDLCEQARRVVVFLEGRPPRTRKKHRRN